MKRQIVLILVVCACLGMAGAVRGRVTAQHRAWAKNSRKIEEKQRLMPERYSTVNLTDVLATGMRPLIADIYWTKATTLKADEIFEMQREHGGTKLPKILADGELERTRRDDFEMYELLRHVTMFDPKFEYAYFYGSHLLAFDGNVDLALSLLDDGFRKNPKSGMIPGMMSFIYYYFLKDWKKGAEYAEISWKNGGKYASRPKEVANLFAAGRDYDLAIDFLYSIRERVNDPTTLDQIDEQLKYLFVEKHIAFLDKAVAKYKAVNGRYPPDLQRMNTMGLIGSIPEEPFGGKYIIGKDGMVTNEPENRFRHYQNMRAHRAGDFHFTVE